MKYIPRQTVAKVFAMLFMATLQLAHLKNPRQTLFTQWNIYRVEGAFIWDAWLNEMENYFFIQAFNGFDTVFARLLMLQLTRSRFFLPSFSAHNKGNVINRDKWTNWNEWMNEWTNKRGNEMSEMCKDVQWHTDFAMAV